MTKANKQPTIRIVLGLAPDSSCDVAVYADTPKERDEALSRLQQALPYLDLLESTLRKGTQDQE